VHIEESEIRAPYGPAAAHEDAAHARTGVAVTRVPRALLLLLVPALTISVLLGLFIGRGSIAATALDPTFLTLRAHRVLVAFFSGAALSVAGAVVQGVFRNPLANPAVLGVTSGALLGTHLALLGTVLLFGGGTVLPLAPEMMVPFGALAGATLALFTLLALASRRLGPLTLLLTGWALMSIFQGISSFLQHVFQEAWELNRAMNVLNVGNISSSGSRQALLIVVMTLGASLPLWLSSATLDVLLTGEEEALSLGVDVQRERFWLVLWVAVLTAGAVAVGGSVAFVGLIIPHAMRPWVGQRHRALLPAVFVAGGIFVVLCDVVCRVLPVRAEIPLGVLTDILGGPVFLRMLLQLARKEQLRAG
jgi:iron complex transport system permease protein